VAVWPDWHRTVDERILRYFEAYPPDYVPLMANRLNVHLEYAERRVELLVEHDLLQPVTNERVYTVTDRGRRLLEAADEATVTTED
jgi:predicted transcriptional regulator